MKHRPLILSLTLALTSASALADSIRTADRIVAVVESEVITARELNHAIAYNRSRQGTPLPENEEKRLVLAQLINQSLLNQMAKRNNLSVSDTEIDTEIANMAAARKQTPAQFLASQARLGIDTAGVKRQVADSLLADKVHRITLLREGRVSDEEVEAVIAANPGAVLPEAEPRTQYRAQHILINGHSISAQRLAAQIAQEARSGKDFASLARQYSQDVSAAAGGDLGWLSEGEAVPEFEEALATLAAGEISRPVRTQYGWHIIRLNEKRRPNSREDRIRAGIRAAISAEKTQAAMTQLLQQLHQGSYIDIRP